MMMKKYGVLAFFLAFAGVAHAQNEVTLSPEKDNTIYETEEGDVSNGAGSYLFAGVTGPNAQTTIRRALLAFDVATEVPDGVRVDSVRLELNVSNQPIGAGTTTFTLHRMERDWGEGDSDAGSPGGAGAQAEVGDATWTHAFFDTTSWDEDGGDFTTDPSAELEVTGTGSVSVVSADGLASDVQAWLDDPETNFGWMLVGDESTAHTARRFDSRENPTEGNRPALTVYYSESTAAEREDLPRTFVLQGSFPNPFSESTTIRYELEQSAEVALTLYDVAGRPVRVVAHGLQTPGPRQIDLDAKGLAAGTYLYCLSSGASRDCGSVTVLP